MQKENRVDLSIVRFERIKETENQLVYKGNTEEITLNPGDWIVTIGATEEHDFVYGYIRDKAYEFLGYGMMD